MKYRLLTLLTPLALLGTTNVVLAQREGPTREERREARQGANENLTPEQRMQNMQQRWQERFNAATPEQQQRMTEMRNRFTERMREAGIDPADPNAFQRMRDAGLFGGGNNRGGNNNQGGANGEGGPAAERGGENRPPAAAPAPVLSKEEQRRLLMTTAGITDRNVQFAIVAFANRQDTARANLLKLAQDAALALSPAPLAGTAKVVEVKATDAQDAPVVDAAPAVVTEAAGEAAPAQDKFTVAMEAYTDAIAKERVRYAAALKTLDKEIKYSSNPRLQGFLMLAGILEFEPLTFGGASAIFAPVVEANAQAQAKAEQEAADNARRVAEEARAKAEALEASLPAGFGGSRRNAVLNGNQAAPAAAVQPQAAPLPGVVPEAGAEPVQ